MNICTHMIQNICICICVYIYIYIYIFIYFLLIFICIIRSQNTQLLADMDIKPSTAEARSRHGAAVDSLLELVGSHPWASSSVLVHYSDREPPDKDQLAHHIAFAVKHAFLTGNPAPPALSRWTGIASCACHFGCLKLFADLLTDLVRACRKNYAKPINSGGQVPEESLDNSKRWELFSQWVTPSEGLVIT